MYRIEQGGKAAIIINYAPNGDVRHVQGSAFPVGFTTTRAAPDSLEALGQLWREGGPEDRLVVAKSLRKRLEELRKLNRQSIEQLLGPPDRALGPSMWYCTLEFDAEAGTYKPNVHRGDSLTFSLRDGCVSAVRYAEGS